MKKPEPQRPSEAEPPSGQCRGYIFNSSSSNIEIFAETRSGSSHFVPPGSGYAGSADNPVAGFRIPYDELPIKIRYFGLGTGSYLQTHDVYVAAARSYDVYNCHEAYVLAHDPTPDVPTPAPATPAPATPDVVTPVVPTPAPVPPAPVAPAEPGPTPAHRQRPRFGTVATVAPAGARTTGAVTPTQQPARFCPNNLPAGDGWSLDETFFGTPAQACEACFARGEDDRLGLIAVGVHIDIYCHEVSPGVVDLYSKTVPAPAPEPKQGQMAEWRFCFNDPPKADSEPAWHLSNIFWHWEDGQACANCASYAENLEIMAEGPVGWIVDGLMGGAVNYYCWVVSPFEAHLYFQVV